MSKIFLQSNKRFWVDEGLSGFATTDLPIRAVYDATYGQPGTRGILQAYPVSLHSRRVTAMSEKGASTSRSNRWTRSIPACGLTSRRA